MRPKASLGSSREVVQGCGVSFANCLYLVPLIIGQNFCATHASVNQTGPNYERARRRRAASGEGRTTHLMGARRFRCKYAAGRGPRGDLNAVRDDRLSVVARRTTASLLPTTKLPARSQSDWSVFARISDQ